MENFTPVSAFIGGSLIGLGAAVLLLFNGRIAGISGILGGLLTPTVGERSWRIMFLLGLIIGGFAIHTISPVALAPRQNYPVWLLILGGFAVGVGTRMGSGCTSGHGVCGVARFSMRSISATLVFILSGAVTVYLIRHVIGVLS